MTQHGFLICVSLTGDLAEGLTGALAEGLTGGLTGGLAKGLRPRNGIQA